MSALPETSLTSMKTAFPTAPELVQGIPMLQSLIELMLHMYWCAQIHKMPASKDMNMLFCAAAPDLYAFFTKEAYPKEFFLFPKEVEEVPDFKNCTNNNQCETLKLTHALAKKTKADIVIINAALLDVFLANLPKLICNGYDPICMGLPNTAFLHMFDWFIKKYGITMAEEREEDRQRMTTVCQPTDGFEQLITQLFLSVSYASTARYPMEERDIIDIGLRVIKRWGMYAEEYKAWIGIKNAGQHASPCVKQTLNSFRGFWSNAITLVNQTSIPASQHGYGMVAIDDNGSSIALYGESLANFVTTYAAAQETVKSQADSLSTIQAQLVGLQQFCMADGQQKPPPNNIYYSPQQQQRHHNNSRNNRRGEGGSSFNGNGGGYPQQPTLHQGQQSGGHGPVHPPTPYKQWENWNYCHTHGSDVEDAHTSATYNRQDPVHDPNATWANMMGGSPAGMHKTILPSASGRTSPPPRQQQQQQERPPISYYPTQNTWQQPPVQFGQQFTMAVPPPQQGTSQNRNRLVLNYSSKLKNTT
jgi:hypothetical protein